MRAAQARLAAAVMASAALPAAADGVPSGQALVLWEVVWERVQGAGTQAVLRFIAPGIAREGGSVDAVAAMADLDWLCRTHGVTVASLPAARSDIVVVTMMDRPVPRGATDPQATQYFGVYSVEGGDCLPQNF